MRNPMIAAVTLSLTVACNQAGSEAPAAPPSETTQKSAPKSAMETELDSIFASFDDNDAPGCAVGIIHRGQYALTRSYGMANLEHNIPITADSVFRIGSVSKQFTAAAIGLLAIQGRLDLDADVHTYLPELKEYGVPVTIRQMVHHVSGMGGYGKPNEFEVRDGKPFRFGNEDYWTIGEFYSAVTEQPLSLQPNEKYQYSNIAYFLLSQVVERASGQTLRQFAEDEMFGPLGMGATFFNDNVDGIVPNRADGYRPLQGGSGYDIFMTNLDWVGDGGIYTSLNDFLLWDQALASGDMPGGDELVTLMLTPNPITQKTMDRPSFGDGAGYGFGLVIGSAEGEPVFGHNGAWVGFRAFYVRFPERDASAVVFCNRADGLAEQKGDALMRLVQKHIPTAQQ